MYTLLDFVPETEIKLGVGDISELSCLPITEKLGSRWVTKRRNEFKAGRVLARKMLAEIGRSCRSIPADSDRVPIWPDGVVGSISHTDEKVVVAVAASDVCYCLGIDAEMEHSVSRELYANLLVDAEMGEIKSSEDAGSKIFCCKESVYKAVFPICREFFDFRDICIDFSGNVFHARCVGSTLRSRSMIIKGKGYTHKHQNHWLALFFLEKAPG